MPAILYYKKISEISHSDISESSLRFLADSNRRTRFCRPLTKPLIQGTKMFAALVFLKCVAKVQLFLKPAIPSERNLYFSLQKVSRISFPP